MIKFNAIPLSPGIAFGNLKKISTEVLEIKRKNIPSEKIEEEIKNFNDVIKKAIGELEGLIKEYSYSKENKEILDAHKTILQDENINKDITKMIREKLLSMEQAVITKYDEIINVFRSFDQKVYIERADDFEDVKNRLLTHILEADKDILEEVDENTIIFADKITPSFVTALYKKNIKGIYLVKGSRTSHTTIIARSMNIPMVSGVKDFEKIAEDGQFLIIDGSKGKIILEPDDITIKEYEKYVAQRESYKKRLKSLIKYKTATKDGKKIKLMTNIEIPEEINKVVTNHSEGIGLFRTEFLFLEKKKYPSEEEQYKIYKDLSERLYPEDVIIRSIDFGGDKVLKRLNISKEKNPYLGYRGIRISLHDTELFKHQIRAILRANIKGNLKLMFPMISDVKEMVDSKYIIGDCIKELKSEGLEFNEKLKVGAMIEIPSAALTSDVIAKESDFLSIGTNDLVQYTLAVDRNSLSVQEYYQPAHPAVIKLIDLTIQNAHKHNIPVAVCGEMASDEKFIPLLIGLDVDELSVSPGLYLYVKDIILKVEYNKVKKLAEVVRKESDVEILYDLLKKSQV